LKEQVYIAVCTVNNARTPQDIPRGARSRWCPSLGLMSTVHVVSIAPKVQRIHGVTV